MAHGPCIAVHLQPNRLRCDKSQEPARQQTVYTVRFTTGRGRDAGIEEPTAGVFLCLIGRDGASFLHRVGPLYDAEDAEANLRTICEVHSPVCHSHHLHHGLRCRRAGLRVK
jgi:hypothetical protein